MLKVDLSATAGFLLVPNTVPTTTNNKYKFFRPTDSALVVVSARDEQQAISKLLDSIKYNALEQQAQKYTLHIDATL